MKFYITQHGECVSTSKYFGEYPDLWEAKQAAFDAMDDGDTLVGFDNDVADPWEVDPWGYKFVDLNLADDENIVTLCRNDGGIEGVPRGKWFWAGEYEPYDAFYNADGSEWEGPDDDPDEF